MKREQFTEALEQLLQPARFRDYCPNGLQVEGRDQISKVMVGVTASQALVDSAVAEKVDALVVHHGYFWKGEDARVVGFRKQRLSALLKNDINLYAYHLPLDAHPLVGNNAQWAKSMGWVIEGTFSDQDIACYGHLPTPLTATALSDSLVGQLQRNPMLLEGDGRLIRKIAWCSGGAQSYFESAIALGIDAFLSGEVSEQTYHLANESGVAYLACGHHATERFGPQALAAWIESELALPCQFVDLNNPV